MKECILISLLFMPICGFYFYNDIEWITRICAANLFLIYTYVYKLSFNDIYFAISITPTTCCLRLTSSMLLLITT